MLAVCPPEFPLPPSEHDAFDNCLHAFTPLILKARQRVRQRAADPSLEESLAANLARPMLQIVARVMVLELNVARLQGQLTGDSPQARFRSFFDRLRDPHIAGELLREYSAMTDLVVNHLDQWSTFSLEFLQHLHDDWDALCETFLGADPGPLVGVQAGAGDPHRNGRSVMILSFANGARVVYKPRSLAVEQHFQELLGWLNARGVQPEFRRLETIDRADHGWSEFGVTAPCASAAEVERFYQRQGGYLALLYALEASDFHCENLIAAGEHPLLVDLETLFHARPAASSTVQADEIAGAALGHSVLRVGLLPVRLWAAEDDAGVDLSGLGSAAGQLTPSAVPYWEAVATDQMHIVRKRLAMPGSRNRPSLNGQEVNALDHVEAIAAGFASTYRLLLQHREELLALIHCFSQDEVRVILRATQTYATLLQESFHPDLLRNARDRATFFDRLEGISDAERRDLLNGDIPLFTTRPASRHLWTSTGEIIENHFDERGLALVERRIRQLSEQDLERQLWVIRASISTLDSRPQGATKRAVARFPQRADIRPEQLIAEARAVGDRLQELAFGGDEDAAWIGLVPTDERTWTLSPLGPDLYDGLPGVVLFLAQLGSVTADRRYTALAQSALATLRRQIERTRDSVLIGAFHGWGGIVYLLSHLGVQWEDSTLIAEAESLLDPIAKLIDRDRTFDVIGGAAGCVLALRSLHRCRPSPRIVEIARACGEHLIRSAQPMGHGIGWLCGGKATAPLTGFAHGNAGIACALLEVFALTGDPRFQQAALQAFNYERSLFSPERGNWPDLRNDAQGVFAAAWCHGAPGIALSRLCSLTHSNHASTMAEIQAALATTFSEGFGGNHSLCHGDLGNAEILLQASRVLDQPDWGLLADHAVTSAVASAHDAGWICGNPLGVESPGFMTGLAGIGYALLRFADPDRIPSVLSLDPPVIHHA